MKTPPARGRCRFPPPRGRGLLIMYSTVYSNTRTVFTCTVLLEGHSLARALLVADEVGSRNAFSPFYFTVRTAERSSQTGNKDQGTTEEDRPRTVMATTCLLVSRSSGFLSGPCSSPLVIRWRQGCTPHAPVNFTPHCAHCSCRNSNTVSVGWLANLEGLGRASVPFERVSFHGIC